MMRLAEVYLNYTEAVLGNSASTTDTEYFNRVRTRAKMESKKALLTKTYATNAVWNLLSKDSIGTISCAVPITASRRLSIT